MKKLCLAVLLLTAQIAFGQVYSPGDNKELIKAISNSINSQDLNCTSLGNGRKLKASDFDWEVILPLFVLEVDDSRQPVIKGTGSAETSEFILDFTTNGDFTVITKIEIKSFKVIRRSIERNTGTIIRPHFETTETVEKVLTEEILCE